jgi:hypothetical protein
MFMSGQKLWFHVFRQDDPEKEATTGKSDGGADDPIKLMSALQSEREKNAAFKKQADDHKKQADDNSTKIKQLEEQLQKVAAIDPAKYEQMERTFRAIEEEAQVKSQQWGELKARYEDEKKVLADEAKSLKLAIQKMEIRNQLGAAFRQTGGLESIPVPDGVEAVDPLNLLVNHFGDRVKFIDNKAVLFDHLGREERNPDGKPKTLSEKMQELKKGSLGNLFEADNKNSGNGTRQTMTRNDGKQMVVYTKEQAASGKADMNAVRRGEAVII